MPEIDAAEFRLVVDGAVEHAMRVSMDELMGLPPAVRTVTLECAGNGRVYLTPPAEGVQWGLGAVGTATWTGVPLGVILRRAGVRTDAQEIVLEGADRGTVLHDSASPEEIAYARGVSVEDAAGVLLAYAMNGEPLSREHGFPLRAVVPGHYAMAAVKWLTRIHVATEPFQGYFQTADYAYWEDGARRPLRAMQLKSSIARPVAGSEVAVGSVVTVAGAAWSGGPAVERVDVSTDGGATWAAAELLDPHETGVWRRWQFAWRVPAAGEYSLVSRATDVAGNAQPGERDTRFGTYVIHHRLPVTVCAR